MKQIFFTYSFPIVSKAYFSILQGKAWLIYLVILGARHMVGSASVENVKSIFRLTFPMFVSLIMRDKLSLLVLDDFQAWSEVGSTYV